MTLDPWDTRARMDETICKASEKAERSLNPGIGQIPQPVQENDWAYEKAWQALTYAQALRSDAKLMEGLRDWLARKEHEVRVQRAALGL
jgi:hypothetical protein